MSTSALHLCRYLLLAVFIHGCEGNQKAKQLQVNSAFKNFDIQGHRGARGVYPENSIPGFVYALELGVTTLEMDVVISADGKLVVSHEPWLSSSICSHPGGTPVTKEEEASLNIYTMSYDEIRKFDCGSRGNERFPQQKKISVFKPLLSEVMDTIEKLIAQKHFTPVHYNIETKCSPQGDSMYHPAPAQFVRLLLDEIRKHHLESRVIVQSFDIRTLEEMHRLAPEIRLAFLQGNDGQFTSILSDLTFTPAIHSPDYHLVNDSLIHEAHSRDIKVIPWTVNDTAQMKRLMEMGVDGIITDYPEMLLNVVKSARRWP